MNILFLVSSSGHYGIENMLLALASNLQTLGYRCVLGVFRDARVPHTEIAAAAEQSGLTVEIVDCNGRIDQIAVKQIRHLFRKHEIDVVHPHGYKADLYAYAAAMNHGVALIATAHNWPSRLWNMRMYAALDRLVLRRFHGVVAVSDVVYRRLLRWGVPVDKLSLIYNGVDVAQFQDAEPSLRREFDSDRTLVGFVGRLVPDKGGAYLLRAAQKVLAVRPDTQFVFVGEGPSRTDWQGLASKLGIADNVVFTGKRNDMPGVYASLDMLVLPSLVESLPMCILEAMAASKPVIATEVGAIPQLVVPQRTGLLVKAGDVEGLTRAILQLLHDPNSTQEMGQNAFARVRQDFSAHAMAKAYIRRYQTIMTGRITAMRSRIQTEGISS